MKCIEKRGERAFILICSILLICISILDFSCSPSRDEREERKQQEQEEKEMAILRKKMVEDQIIARGIKDEQVIQAMLKVPRHKFVPADQKQFAYDDRPLLIGEEQDITQPYIIALMIESLQLEENDRVLEIGTGSGYQTALLAEIAGEVYSIEIRKALAQKAEARLKEMGYKNFEIKVADGYRGWKENAPFDKILVSAAPSHIPEPLIEQLKLNGKMVIPVGRDFQELLLLSKEEQGIKEYHITPVKFVPMEGEAEKKKQQ
jgi:protein-L-isoaspartate(D-aspartate) O-methyltransferase